MPLQLARQTRSVDTEAHKVRMSTINKCRYGPVEKRTLSIIRRSRDLGFTLEEIRALLALGGQSGLRVPMCTRSRARIWPTSVKNSPTSSSLKPSWRKRLRNAQTELPPTAQCSIFWTPAGQEFPARARANGGRRSARTMSGISTAMGISQYMK
jgi:DNA-binding transcriptional MerR regulator